MAWRPTQCFLEGELDNTTPGKVAGWMRFTGMEETVTFDLEGDFHRDIRGAKVRLHGEEESANAEDASCFMQGFSTIQKGKVGDMTAGREPVDYVSYPYFEWYSEDNGRVVLELQQDQIEILTPPIPVCESDPINRQEQAMNMANYLNTMASELGLPEQCAIAVGGTVAVERAKKIIANDKLRGMKLLTKELREILPSLGSQDGKAGKVIVYVKYFTPSSSWTWYCLEGEPVLDEKSCEIDFQFFGLVDGHDKELGYFMLSELEEVRGPLGMPIERDLYWQPKTLEEIAPEMFPKQGNGGAR